MTVDDIIEAIKKLPKRTQLVVIDGAETIDGDSLPTGLAYLDIENKEYVYIGEIEIIEDED